MKNFLITIAAIISLPITLPTAAFLLLRYAALRTQYILFILKNKEITGAPLIAEEHWKLQEGPTCAIEAQRIILAVFGVTKETSDLSARQQAYGKFKKNVGSTSIKLLLDGYGISTQQMSEEEKSSNFTIWKHLHQGRLILATTNSYLLNNTDEFTPPNRPIHDHTIIITSLISTPKGTLAIYTDTGSFDGSLKAVYLKHLKESIRSGITLLTPKTPRDGLK